ncbi:hypothetical protein NU219Hw_g7695t1 [Hortaea werneckii]
MKAHGKVKGSVRDTLFTGGSEFVRSSFLQRIGYQPTMSNWSTPFQDDSSEAGDVGGHDRTAIEQSQNRSSARPTMSPLTPRTSPRGSLDEIAVDHSSTAHAIEAPMEIPTSQRSSDTLGPGHTSTSLPIAPSTQCADPRVPLAEPLANLVSESSAAAASKGNLNAQDSCVERASKEPGTSPAISTRKSSPETQHSTPKSVSNYDSATSAIEPQTEGSNAQQPLVQPRATLPHMGTFSVPDSEVQNKMQRISRDIENAVLQLFLSSGIEIGQPAEFESNPTLELEELYESALGTKDWKSRAKELQFYGVPVASDLLIALVGAAVHRWVLEKVHSWQGPAQEYPGSKCSYEHFARRIKEHTGSDLDTLRRLAAIDECQDAAYGHEEIRPKAKRLAGDLDFFLAQHFRRIFRNQPDCLSHALEEQWSAALTDLFAGVLLLADRLRLTSEEYAFTWPGGKEPFQGHSMQSKYSAEEHPAFRQVVIALWPGVAVADGKVGIQVVSRAYVIAARSP